MCGIAGIVSRRRIDSGLLQRMAGAIAHRGPDDEGLWVDAEANVGLAHRRLSIVDLSPQGHQPMLSADGRFVLDYNGEIYNHAALRKTLEAKGQAPEGGWRGHSDTETLLQAIACWGLKAAVEQSVGMFAFALWDRKERVLSLVRDRFGEKPLYYGWAGNDFLFGSELKALRLHPDFNGEIDREALGTYAARTYVPAPKSIYRRIFKLEPASILSVPLEAALQPSTEPLKSEPYWSYRDVVRGGMANPISDEDEALEVLDAALDQAIAGQSMADVPVGAFLSGGIDSSTVCALYQRHSKRKIRTFTIAFEDAAFNEADYASEVARHLGTEHSEHLVTVREARDVIPLLPAIYDEPFADSSQIPTYLVSRFAREEVTVALTGDGGDELFAGYNRHFQAPRLWQRLKMVPKPLRAAAGASLGLLPQSLWQGAAGLLPARHRHLGGKANKALRLAGSAASFDDVYAAFLDEWSGEASPVSGWEGGQGALDLDLGGGAPDPLRIMYCDAVSYLPDDILCKVDRASMAVSLETRVPFLDHRVAEIAARIPLGLKIRGGEGKHILRQLLYRHVPRHHFERPKAGFAVPVGDWIKGPLRPWAEELLSPQRLAGEGFFNAEAVRRRWDDHLTGRRNSTNAIWAVLMFQAWLDSQSKPVQLAA
ncbi:asparagine synthase (glutamine-hydrolyzing) [Sphingomonas alba]|uniref:asparagine synthase (glutamine-hydrolyzing) n=1 Tax=Sphingomonas alba TaxID=2908208 RepID=A0ABT0RJC6_9SPHN|nr:asparagine synthase (glutamine-hydrolyzing) [Sphingomonas alba]MCL6682700.1 asparagine synthase (glutamine-hydrolyzing) [Sphingomonas alba]